MRNVQNTICVDVFAPFVSSKYCVLKIQTIYIQPHLHTSLLPPGHTVTNGRTGCIHFAWPEDGLAITTTYIQPHLHTSLLPPGHTVTNWRTGCMHYAWPEDGLDIYMKYIQPYLHISLLPPRHTVTNWRTGCMHYAWPEDGLAITTTYIWLEFLVHSILSRRTEQKHRHIMCSVHLSSKAIKIWSTSPENIWISDA